MDFQPLIYILSILLHFIISITLLILVIVTVIIIVPNKKVYACHIKGCDREFKTIGKLINHMIHDHDYNINNEEYYV